MKTNILYLAVILLFLSSCQDNTSKSQADPEAEKILVNKTVDKFYEFAKAKKIDALKSLITDDVIVMGSDPSEIWNKDEIMKIFKDMMDQDQLDINPLGNPVLQIAPDGMSAIVVQHFLFYITPNIKWRHTYYLRKVDDQWMIAFWSTSLTPDNADLQKMNSALDAAEVQQ